jgi:hypothetical protein
MKRLLMFMLIFAGTLVAQAPDLTEAQPAQKATVYVYRLKMFYAKLMKPTIFCDSKDLGRIENGRFMKLEIEPGKHFFRSNDAQSGFEAELKPGHEYYVRVDMIPSGFKGHGRVLFVANEQGTEEIKRVFQQ